MNLNPHCISHCNLHAAVQLHLTSMSAHFYSTDSFNTWYNDTHLKVNMSPKLTSFWLTKLLQYASLNM